MSRKYEFREEPDYADMAKKMLQENSDPHVIADFAKVDWCPCCGVNIRFFKDDKLIAKLICPPKIALKLSIGIEGMSREMLNFCRTPEQSHAHTDALQKIIIGDWLAKLADAKEQ